MSLARLLTQPLTISTIVPAGVDTYGNEVTGAYGAPVAVRGYLAQSSSTEFTTDRDTVVGQWVAYLPASTSIGHLDRVSFDGQTFEVDGEPERVYNPRRKFIAYIEARLKVVEG